MLCYGIWIKAPLRGVLHPLLKPTDKRDAQQKGPYIGDFAHDIKEDFISVPSRVVFVSVGRAGIDLPAGYCKRSNEHVTMPGSGLSIGLEYS